MQQITDWVPTSRIGYDPMTDPHNSTFRKTLDLCEGTVTVLDQEANCYTRVWCVYEIFTTLSEKKDVFERGGSTT